MPALPEMIVSKKAKMRVGKVNGVNGKVPNGSYSVALSTSRGSAEESDEEAGEEAGED
jgi:hypothetical protein